MSRVLLAALMTLALVPAAAQPQDMATRRATRTIRAQEKEVLNRVTQRVEWDKQLSGSTLQIDVQPGGVVLLKGSVMSEAARARAIDLVESTTGVTSVVDELGVVKHVKVIDAKPAPTTEGDAQATSLPTTSRIISRP